MSELARPSSEEILPGRYELEILQIGNNMSRERFSELASIETLSGERAFRLLMRTSLALAAQRSRIAAIGADFADDESLVGFWRGAHALCHLASLAYTAEASWLADMIDQLRPTRWTPTFAVTCERMMGPSLHGAYAAGSLPSCAFKLYLSCLDRPVQPLLHFDAVLALTSFALQQPGVATEVRSAIDAWAKRQAAASAFRVELRRSFAMVFEQPGLARSVSLAWCRKALCRWRGASLSEILEAGRRHGVQEDETLVLAALAHIGDNGVVADGLFPAVLLLSCLRGCGAERLYPPASIQPFVSEKWTPLVGARVMQRTIRDSLDVERVLN